MLGYRYRKNSPVQYHHKQSGISACTRTLSKTIQNQSLSMIPFAVFHALSVYAQSTCPATWPVTTRRAFQWHLHQAGVRFGTWTPIAGCYQNHFLIAKCLRIAVKHGKSFYFHGPSIYHPIIEGSEFGNMIETFHNTWHDIKACKGSFRIKFSRKIRWNSWPYSLYLHVCININMWYIPPVYSVYFHPFNQQHQHIFPPLESGSALLPDATSAPPSPLPAALPPARSARRVPAPAAGVAPAAGFARHGWTAPARWCPSCANDAPTAEEFPNPKAAHPKSYVSGGNLMANMAKSHSQHALLLHVLTKDEELEVTHESESDFLRGRCQISHDNTGSKNLSVGRPLEKPIKSRHHLL